MIGINTRTAIAFVTDQQSCLNGPVKKFPREPVCRLPLFIRKGNDTVVVELLTAVPEPTSLKFYDVLFEFFFSHLGSIALRGE